MTHNSASLTGVERTFSEDEFIVSKTDKTGKIIYCNTTCLEIAGYKEDELIGQQHNILRHPDMPSGVFKLLWDTVAGDNEILAYVVNKCKNGDHYWVLAHITPSYDKQNNIVGYLSSRRVATQEALDVIKPLYKTLLAEEDKYSSKKEGMAASTEMLTEILAQKNATYSEFVFNL